VGEGVTVYVQDTDFTLHHGDVLDILPTAARRLSQQTLLA
jgi:hypothetical protein